MKYPKGTKVHVKITNDGPEYFLSATVTGKRAHPAAVRRFANMTHVQFDDKSVNHGEASWEDDCNIESV